MLSVDIRAGRLSFTLAVEWEQPEPDEQPPPMPHLAPLDPLEIDDEGLEDGRLGFRA